MLIDEHRDRTAFDNILAPTVQRESGLPEVTNRESKLEFGIEPSFDNTLLVGSDFGYAARLQRAQMRVDNFACKFGLVIVGAKLGTHSPQYECDEKKCRGGSQPLPKKRLRRGRGGRDRVEMSVNCPPQRGGGRLIDLSKLQSPAQPIQVHEFSRAVGAMSDVALEFGSPAIT
jgi:hypothetical protein